MSICSNSGQGGIPRKVLLTPFSGTFVFFLIPCGHIGADYLTHSSADPLPHLASYLPVGQNAISQDVETSTCIQYDCDVLLDRGGGDEGCNPGQTKEQRQQDGVPHGSYDS